jgi:hypothetical protein
MSIAEIERAVWTYLDGLYEGDTAKLASAFHPRANLYWEEGGEHREIDQKSWYERVSNRPSPRSKGDPRHDAVITIDLAGPSTAFVKVRCAIPPRFFTDYLTLLKLSDGWKIVTKTYHTELRG